MRKRWFLIALLMMPLLLSGCVLNKIMDDVVNQAPKAVIDATPREGAGPLTVTLDGRYSHDDDGSIVEYRWDFGDPASMGTQIQDQSVTDGDRGRHGRPRLSGV